MPRVLITSRSNDADIVARRLQGDLIDAFGHNNVLNDHIRVQPGLDVRGELARRITHSHAVLVVIGRFWEGDSRLHNPTDSVRLCIELGLQAVGLRLIPVLVEGAVMPHPDALPPSIRDFGHRSPISVREKPDYMTDLERLIAIIDEAVVEDKTYGSTPARLSTIAKPPADIEARMAARTYAPPPPAPPSPKPAPPHRTPPPAPTVVSAQGGGAIGYVFRLIRKLIGDFVAFVLSLFATAARQMVKSTVSFIMGLVLIAGLLALVAFLVANLLSGGSFDIQQTIDSVLAALQGLLGQAPPD